MAVKNIALNTAPVILAGGYGSFDNGMTPKVLEKINGVPLIIYVARVFQQALGVNDPFVVVNEKFASVIQQTMNEYGFIAHFVVQEKRVGNAGAVELCLPVIEQTRWRESKHVAVLFADMPCWQASSIEQLLINHRSSKAKMSLFYIDLARPGCSDTVKTFGRVLYDGNGDLIGAFEPQDLPDDVAKRATRVNPSAYVFYRAWLSKQLPYLKRHDPGDGFPPETWLPDLVGVAVDAHDQVKTIELTNSREALGINTPGELELVREYLNQQGCSDGSV